MLVSHIQVSFVFVFLFLYENGLIFCLTTTLQLLLLIPLLAHFLIYVKSDMQYVHL